jgi:hypothetical protein
MRTGATKYTTRPRRWGDLALKHGNQVSNVGAAVWACRIVATLEPLLNARTVEDM